MRIIRAEPYLAVADDDMGRETRSAGTVSLVPSQGASSGARASTYSDLSVSLTPDAKAQEVITTPEFDDLHPYPDVYYEDDEFFMDELQECSACGGLHDEEDCPFVEGWAEEDDRIEDQRKRVLEAIEAIFGKTSAQVTGTLSG